MAADSTVLARDPALVAPLMRRATYASVAVATVLIAAKGVAWLATDSVSVLSSLLDSLLDAAASLINLLAVRHALTPPDREHRFGHGKAEPLAGLAQAAFIAGSAALLILEAGRRLATPVPVSRSEVGIGVMLFSIVLTALLVVYQRRVVARTQSVAISADSLHYAGDLLVNGSVIVSLLLVGWLGWPFIDPLFAIGVALYILWSAIRIVRLSLNVLMDRELPDAERSRIRAIATEHPEVRSVHDLRTRSSGPSIFIQLHLEMDGGLTLMRAHEIADAVEAKLMQTYPNAEIIIHQDPEGVDERRKIFAPASDG